MGEAMTKLRRIAIFCLGPYGSTALFAVVTGLLSARLGWFGVGMAGTLGLLVARQLERHDGPAPGLGTGGLRRMIRQIETQTPRPGRDDRPSAASGTEPGEPPYLLNAASLAMVVLGFYMFLRYQVGPDL